MRCAELDADTKNPQLKATLSGAAANWIKLARDLEAMEAILAVAMPDPAQFAAGPPAAPSSLGVAVS
jgi:hypothetical protein